MAMPSSRAVRPMKILGSTVNMVDMPYIMEWMESAIKEYRTMEASDSPVATKHLMVAGYHGVIQAKKSELYYKIGEEALVDSGQHRSGAGCASSRHEGCGHHAGTGYDVGVSGAGGPQTLPDIFLRGNSGNPGGLGVNGRPKISRTHYCRLLLAAFPTDE